MRDITYQLDGIVDDLFGVIDTLELGLFVEVYKILIEVEAGSGEQRSGVVMQVGGNALAFLFLQSDGGIQKRFLLILLHFLKLLLIADDFPLVKADEYDESYREGQHADRAEEQHHRNIVIRTQSLQ